MLLLFGINVKDEGIDYVASANQTLVYTYNPFNFTTNTTTLANVSTIANPPLLVKKQDEFTDAFGYAAIILGLFVPIGALLYQLHENDERKKRKNEEGE
jgi:hypothetical protein